MIDRLLNAIGLVWKAEDGVHFNVTTEHYQPEESTMGLRYKKKVNPLENIFLWPPGRLKANDEGMRLKVEAFSHGNTLK